MKERIRETIGIDSARGGNRTTDKKNRWLRIQIILTAGLNRYIDSEIDPEFNMFRLPLFLKCNQTVDGIIRNLQSQEPTHKIIENNGDFLFSTLYATRAMY